MFLTDDEIQTSFGVKGADLELEKQASLCFAF